MDTTEPEVDEAPPSDAVEQENGETALPPEDEGAGDDARRHAERLEQHNRPVDDPAVPDAPG